MALTDYAGSRRRISLMEQSLIGHKVIPSVFHDPAKASSIKDINSPRSDSVQWLCLTLIEVVRQTRIATDMKIRNFVRVERDHNAVGNANTPYNFIARPTIIMHYTSKVC